MNHHHHIIMFFRMPIGSTVYVPFSRDQAFNLSPLCQLLLALLNVFSERVHFISTCASYI